MSNSTRFLVGCVTSTLWLGSGVYMFVLAPAASWRWVSVLLVAVGVFRGFLAWRERQRFLALQAPPDEDDESLGA